MTVAVQVQGGTRLCGSVRIQGAKNAVLVELAALLLVRGVSVLRNVPDIADVHSMLDLLRAYGAVVLFDPEAHVVEVDARTIDPIAPSTALLKSFRASILTVGPLLGRCGKAFFDVPGGCPIGTRPINFHRDVLLALGATELVTEQGLYLNCPRGELRGVTYFFDYPSVGATENALLAAVCATGRTRLGNVALEPEVFDLIELLRAMGARISCELPATILVDGVEPDELKAVDFTVMPDRLEAGAWACAAALTGGGVELIDAPIDSLGILISKLERMGHSVDMDGPKRRMRVRGAERYRAVSAKTMPYPGFPTDIQPAFLALLACAEGEATITETVFENRFLAVPGLCAMGAQIGIEGCSARVNGVAHLAAARVAGTDIRATAALIIAALRAEGTSLITGVHYLNRGYERFVDKINQLGGRAELVDIHDQN